MKKSEKTIEIEFTGDNYMRLSNIAWMLLLIKRIEMGYDLIEIENKLKKNGYTKNVLEEAIDIANYDRQIIRQYGDENGINPDFLREYIDIDPLEYHYLIEQNP